jgi:hypothetical protein
MKSNAGIVRGGPQPLGYLPKRLPRKIHAAQYFRILRWQSLENLQAAAANSALFRRGQLGQPQVFAVRGPLLLLGVGQRSAQNRVEPRPRPASVSQLIRVLTGAQQRPLHDLVRLDATTSATLDEGEKFLPPLS